MRDLLDDNCVVSSRKMQALLPLGIGQITRAGGSTISIPSRVHAQPTPFNAI